MRAVAGLIALCEAFATLSAGTPAMLVTRNSRFQGPVEVHIERAGTTGGGTVWGVNLLGPSNANRQDFVGASAVTTFQTSIAYAALSNNNWVCKIDRSPRTGTVTTVAGSKTVTGSGTAFTTELKVGCEIAVNGEIQTVAAIASTTSLTTEKAWTGANAAVAVALVDDILVPTTDFTVSDVGGFALITLSAAAKLATGMKMEVHFVVPVSLYTFATATTSFVKREVQGYDLMWYVTGATTAPSATNVYVRPLGG